MADKRKVVIEREHMRLLLVVYDALVMLVFMVLMSVIFKITELSSAFIHFLILFAFMFVFSIPFKTYRQIWRNSTMRSFGRQMAGDTIATAVYTMLAFIVYPRQLAAWIPSFDIAAIEGLLCMVLKLLIRILYYYMYWRAKHNQDGLLCKLIKLFGQVDFSEEENTAGDDAERSFVSNEPINELIRIANRFQIHGTITRIKQVNRGYINRTYKVETFSEHKHVHKYILQRINTNVFPNVDGLMSNYVKVTQHLHDRFILPGEKGKGSVQMVRLTTEDKPYFKDDSGYWRMMTYFEDVYSLDIPDHPETFYQSGRAFGGFIKNMVDMDPNELCVVIPNFHNTEMRYQALEKSISKDPVQRVQRVQKEIEFVRNHKYLYNIIASKLESGELPTRICHNDCNLNNILFDNKTRLPVAIIDLDTVMPSSPLYDYGDSMRVGTNTATDDEKDLSKVSCDLEMYKQYARGYLQACGDILTELELKLLPYASLVITSEDSIRFLMDYIDGDTYYTIYYPEQNLDRARTQLKLLEDMERKLPEIKSILRSIYAELGLKATIE